MYYAVLWCVVIMDNSLQLFLFNVYLRIFDWCSHTYCYVLCGVTVGRSPTITDVLAPSF